MDLTDSIRLLLARSNRFLGGRIRFRTRLQPLLYIFFLHFITGRRRISVFQLRDE